jgi:hypothetical protein
VRSVGVVDHLIRSGAVTARRDRWSGGEQGERCPWLVRFNPATARARLGGLPNRLPRATGYPGGTLLRRKEAMPSWAPRPNDGRQ